MADKIRHGTRGAYINQKCRCEKCSAANSAYAYALRKVKGWDEPIAKRLIVAEEPSAFGSIAISADVLREALNNLADTIKTEALSVLWLRKKGAKV